MKIKKMKIFLFFEFLFFRGEGGERKKKGRLEEKRKWKRIFGIKRNVLRTHFLFVSVGVQKKNWKIE